MILLGIIIVFGMIKVIFAIIIGISHAVISSVDDKIATSTSHNTTPFRADMSGLEYEQYCANVLEKYEYSNISITQTTGDQGVDILAQKDGIKWGFQCKHYSSPVGNKAIQEVYAGASYYKCLKAAVITNNNYTKSAYELANQLNVVLMKCDSSGLKVLN
ncbi:MAG: restriction endonuclease [Lachnospiraceae bacterium]|nr:restriction endonuclease [Lachnospiraceae bacterium]